MAEDRRKALLAALVLAGLAARLWFLLEQTWLEGDFAVMGLMAKHVLEGKEWPVYVWLNQYSGCLTTYLMALGFRLLGISAVTYWLTGFFSSCASAALLSLLARRLFGSRAAFFTAALALVPPYTILYITFWYQYGDTLTLGTLFLILLDRYWRESRRDAPWLPAALGLLSGVGLWTSPHFTPFLLVEAWLAWRKRDGRFTRDLGLWAAFFIVGYAPAIHYSLHHPGAQAHRFAGRFLSVGRAEWEGSHSRGRLLVSLLWRRLLRVPSIVARMPTQFASLAGWIDLAALTAATWLTRRERVLVQAYLVCFLLFHALAVGDAAERMMFLLYLPLAVLGGKALADAWDGRRAASAAALGALLCAHAWSLWGGLRHPDRMSVAELNAFLRSKGIEGAYSDYWAAYTAIFDSNERIIVSPTLFHPTFDDRYPEYTERVRADPKAAIIVDTSRNGCAIPKLERGLARLGVKYEKTQLAEFRVYTDLTPRVFPERLELTQLEHCGKLSASERRRAESAPN